MNKRFVLIWFRYLRTDWFTRRQPALHNIPFVLSSPDHGRMVITAANALAHSHGIDIGMTVADARVILPSLHILDDKPEHSNRLLKGLAEWCIRYSPFVAIDSHDGLILDATGCTHLWSGEETYLADIITRLKTLGYNVRAAMTNTIGAAWAIAHYGKESFIVKSHQQTISLLSLPVEALRLEHDIAEKLHSLGLKQIGNIIGMQRSALRRRFGEHILQRLDQAVGNKEEIIEPVLPVEPYQERLPCLESIVTATGIEIALQRLLETICHQLQLEQKGLRVAILKCHRADNKVVQIEIGTNHPTFNIVHLFKLFELKIETIEPGPGIDLFILEARKVEAVSPLQQKLWQKSNGLDNIYLSELMDRFSGKFGANHIHRFFFAEDY